MDFKTIKLGDIYDVASGLSKSAKEFGHGGYPFVSFKTIFYNYFLPDELPDIVNTTENERAKCSVLEGDIFLTRTSETANELGMSCVALKDYPDATFNGFSKRLRKKVNVEFEIYPKYIGYYLRSDQFRNQINSMSIASTRASLNIEMINRLTINLPDIIDQKKIADLLFLLDSKIRNNESINRNLSEQAETLFKSWFEDYEPWNGEMPKDWKQGVLGDFVTIKRGGSPRPIQEFFADDGLRWLKISDVSGLQSPYVLDIAEHIIEAGLKKTVHLEEGALVLSNSATPGIPKILDVDSCIHDGWLYFPESQLSNYFLYLFYKSIRPKLVALGNGSVFTNLKTDILKGYSFSKPDDDTLNRFDELVTPMFKTMREVARENKQLSEIRDSLLPKLMSGELDVSDLDI